VGKIVNKTIMTEGDTDDSTQLAKQIEEEAALETALADFGSRYVIDRIRLARCRPAAKK
jgi:ribosomal protein L20A (L18A)